MRMNRWMVMVLAMLFVLPGCGGRGPAGGEDADGPGSGPLSAKIKSGDIAITNSSGEIVVVIGEIGDNTRIAWVEGGQERTLAMAKTASGMEYRGADGGVMATVVDTGAGFNVSVAGQAWPVAVSPETVEVGGLSPFLVKTQNENKFLIYSGGTQIGYLKYYPDQLKIKVKDMAEKSQFKSNSNRVSAMYGMMMMPNIPDAARYVLMAEIVRRNR